jgi:Family of unknown function (DUF5719)
MPGLGRITTRRIVVLAALAALSAAVIMASVAVRPPHVRGALASDATAVDRLPGATSSQWSCAGPLPVGDASVLSAVELANSGRAAVSARFSFVTSLGRNRTGDVSVPPGGVVVLRPPVVSKPGFAAAGVVAQGSGLSVVEVVHSPQGPDAASCARSASTTAYLVAGDTRRTDDVMLSLFDPGSTPAVADVTVATPSGVQSPPALQGLPIGAGQVATYSIAQRVPFAPALAITVRSSAGSLVVGALSSDRVDGTDFDALEPGILDPSPQWSFSAAPAGPAAQQTIDLFNPSPRSAKVSVSDSTSSGTARIGVIIPADAVAHVALPTEPKTRALGSVEIDAARGAPLIAARTTVIGAAIPAAKLPEKSAVQRARRALDLVPRTPVGYTVTNGTPRPARLWLVDGGEHDRSDATELVVTNPNEHSVKVTVRPAGAKAPWISGLVVSGGTTAVVDFADLKEATGRFGLVVEASAPVVATGTIYANGSTGFTSPAAIPFG